MPESETNTFEYGEVEPARKSTQDLTAEIGSNSSEGTYYENERHSVGNQDIAGEYFYTHDTTYENEHDLAIHLVSNSNQVRKMIYIDFMSTIVG